MVQDLDSKFEKIIKGQVQFKSANLAYNLLVSRLQRKYQTSTDLESCLQEMNVFFEKYCGIMGKEIEELKKL